ncbi:hypothetical protein E2C01_025399 [Portunus trituberculatus]|uniref:Uncharacterized protein n=1 Tax=Portunus trituberculatus TaxID=210409 RepID=A0A5B7EHU3_PORTR|nr:hypothetical protein [Portunus trituberculatus]
MGSRSSSRSLRVASMRSTEVRISSSGGGAEGSGGFWESGGLPFSRWSSEKEVDTALSSPSDRPSTMAVGARGGGDTVGGVDTVGAGEMVGVSEGVAEAVGVRAWGVVEVGIPLVGREWPPSPPLPPSSPTWARSAMTTSPPHDTRTMLLLHRQHSQADTTHDSPRNSPQSVISPLATPTAAAAAAVVYHNCLYRLTLTTDKIWTLGTKHTIARVQHETHTPCHTKSSPLHVSAPNTTASHDRRHRHSSLRHKRLRAPEEARRNCWTTAWWELRWKMEDAEVGKTASKELTVMNHVDREGGGELGHPRPLHAKTQVGSEYAGPPSPPCHAWRPPALRSAATRSLPAGRQAKTCSTRTAPRQPPVGKKGVPHYFPSCTV